MDCWQVDQEYGPGPWQPANGEGPASEASSDLLFLDSPTDSYSYDHSVPPMPPDLAVLHLQLAEAFREPEIPVRDLDFGGFQAVALAARPTASGANQDCFDASELEMLDRSRSIASTHQQHRPAPLRRPSNPPACTLVDGPTPKNADDAEQTCDNRRLFWEQDPNWKSPRSPPFTTETSSKLLTAAPVTEAAAPPFTKPVPLPSAGVTKPVPRPPEAQKQEPKPVPPTCARVTKPMPLLAEQGGSGKKPLLSTASSFKQKKLPGCQIELEVGKHANYVHRLDDDRQTFDNFDRLWENDPRFVDASCSVSSSTCSAAPKLQTNGDRSKKVEPQDIIQKHTVNLVNLVRSSAGKEEEPQQWCKSKVIYDPMMKRERRFTFELRYEVLNQTEGQGSADATIRNAAVVIKCDVHVQVVLKVDPKKESERKFLYSFVHNIKVISDFKLESEACMQHISHILPSASTPEQFLEPGTDVTHHKVLHFVAILHSWAVAASPRHMPRMQRRISASTSLSAAHQDPAAEGEAGGELMAVKGDEAGEGEEDQKSDGAAAVGKAVRNSRCGRRSYPYLQRSSSK